MLANVIDPAAILIQHVPMYRYRYPRYQVTLLRQLERVWQNHHNVLDVGGGSGIIAQAIHEMFGCEVMSVDVVDRFAKSLSIRTAIYDGVHLPFQRTFDAITFNNVLHHVPPRNRITLLRESARVCSGPIYIKDHLPISPLDRVRLATLDAIGNLPFGGMVKANYLSKAEWESLRSAIQYKELHLESGGYRRSVLFPDRLEIFMKWVPNAS